ncbi:MAG: hypothetical protein AAF653_21860, partial [Chloroflexota bacterium]
QVCRIFDFSDCITHDPLQYIPDDYVSPPCPADAEGCALDYSQLRTFDEWVHYEWITHNRAFAFMCNSSMPDECGIGLIDTFWPSGSRFGTLALSATYNHEHDVTAVLASPERIYMTGDHTGEFHISEFTDETITSIEWMPSLFYRDL